MEAGQIFIERLTESYTGMPLIGVGGYLPPELCEARIEVQYDGQTAATLSLTPTADNNVYHFSTQLPIEPGLRLVSVVLVQGGRKNLLAEESLERIAPRPEPEFIADRRPLAKVIGTWSRGIRSVMTGEVLSISRWQARLDRLSETLLRFRQRVQRRIVLRSFRPRTPHDAYVERSTLSAEQHHKQKDVARRLARRPLISILMPVHQVDPRWLRIAIASVVNQTYDRWQLCLVDDASTRVDLLAEFEKLPDDPRIRFVRRAVNGHICAASNTAADLATGEFIALLDHDDALAPNALYEVCQIINEHPSADLIYSDEDKIDADGRRYDPQHKPDWSPELLLSYNYINHFTVLRRSLFERVGRFRIGYEGSQDHDLLLRVTEQTDQVVHIPRILYHWRSLPSSTASSAGVKSYVHTSGRKAVEGALRRRGLNPLLSVPAFAERLGLPVLTLAGRNDGSRVAIIVHGDQEAADRTVQRIRAITTYLQYTIIYCPESDAAALNQITAARNEEHFVFVAAGLLPSDGEWLSRMLAYARIPGVGVVGGRLPHGAGIVLTPQGPRESFEDLPPHAVSYYFYAEVARNVAAPSRGLLLVSRSTFERLRGFDLSRFPRTLHELDFASRCRKLGLRCVHVGGVKFEGQCRCTVDPREWLTFRSNHDVHDPYSNPHFDPPFKLRGDAGGVPAKPRQPLRALIAAHNLNNPEGAPRYLSEIILGLSNRGVVAPSVLSPRDGLGGDVYRQADLPVTILTEPWSQQFVDAQWTPRSYEACQKHLLKLFRQERPEIVIANTLLTFPVVEAAARLGIPSVWIIHESYSPEVLDRFFSPLARARCEAAFALASRIVPASYDTASLFRRCDTRHTIRVIHNGIDPSSIDAFCRNMGIREARQQLGLDPRKCHIIAVGTVCERKGQHTLIEAAARLARTRRDFQCHLVGMRDAVPYANYVRHLAIRRDIADCVNFVPETGDVFTWYRAADIFVCTSHMETYSRAILEAEIFSLPIVSTRCHGVGEQVIWGENAIPFGNAKELAERLARLISDPALRSVMGAKSRAVFDAHESYDVMLDNYQAVIQLAANRSEAVASVVRSHRAAA